MYLFGVIDFLRAMISLSVNESFTSGIAVEHGCWCGGFPVPSFLNRQPGEGLWCQQPGISQGVLGQY